MLFPSEETGSRHPNREGEGLRKPASWDFCMALSLCPTLASSIACGARAALERLAEGQALLEWLTCCPRGALGCFLDTAGQVLGLWWNRMPALNQGHCAPWDLREESATTAGMSSAHLIRLVFRRLLHTTSGDGTGPGAGLEREAQSHCLRR